MVVDKNYVNNTPVDQKIFHERRIHRLENHLEKMRSLDRKFGTLRILVFFLGLGLVVVAWFLSSPANSHWAFFVAILMVAIFIVVVFMHRRLEDWIARFTIWLTLTREQLARINLDWKPFPVSQPYEPRSGLDIDLDLTGPRSLHQLLDLAVSRQGSQRLAAWLTTPTPDVEAILSRQAVVKELSLMRRFRMRLQLNFRRISKEQLDGSGLLEWFQVELPRNRLKWLLLAGSLFTFFNLVLFILNILGYLPAYWIFSFAAYLAFYYFTAKGLTEYLEAVVELDRELDKFGVLLRTLERYPLPRQPNLSRLLAPYRDPANLPSNILRRIKWITAGVGIRSNPIIHLLINMFTPWDYLFAMLTGGIQGRLAGLLPVWLETWTQLEALTSLAEYAGLNPDFAFPQFNSDNQAVLKSQKLAHPLIPGNRRIGNDFVIHSLGEVLVITGSNMAGKSTFLKAVGVNLCLAYAGGPVCASSLSLIPLRLHTCIRISDSIADGFSYFYAEVKCLRSLLEELREDNHLPLLYLIDEIFRGTNNRERLQGSRSYTRALIGANGSGLIATHDLELAHLAEQDRRVNNFHFRDEVQNGRLVFDYQIRPGPSPTTNALKIMELEGLPLDKEH